MNVVSIISIVINIVCAIYNSCIGNSTLGLAELTVAICFDCMKNTEELQNYIDSQL